MPRPETDQDLVPSVLDRLIDREPRVRTESWAQRSGRVSDIKDAVKRDLEWLLNSRQSLVTIPPGLAHVQQSLLTYGLPDFTHASLTSASDQDRLRRAVEQTIRRFEPRLTSVVVTLVEGREFERKLRFRIDALLRVEPNPEPVTFDSVLELSTKAFMVQGG